MTRTLKRNPWKGWKMDKPGFHERTTMFEKCGKRCFLGSNKSFPICKKGTCRVSKKGLYAAYIRARQYRSRSRKYAKISQKARRMLTHK